MKTGHPVLSLSSYTESHSTNCRWGAPQRNLHQPTVPARGSPGSSRTPVLPPRVAATPRRQRTTRPPDPRRPRHDERARLGAISRSARPRGKQWRKKPTAGRERAAPRTNAVVTRRRLGFGWPRQLARGEKIAHSGGQQWRIGARRCASAE